jgi:chromosome partition protein MukB
MKLFRAYARRLVVANWKGIVFHCFDLDRYVTGLEGQNGAGKTTVMAAFVTAILPNQRLLTFKNNGGSSGGRSDPGLWGRLGEGGVCYSLIEWITPHGKSLWAGVAMMRGAMPSIDIKHLMIEDLSPEASAHDALLVREGSSIIVPQLPRLRDHVTLNGGKLTIHKSLGDYMKALFERGITPMPMTGYEEQERFYRVLSTSMEGSALASLVKTGLRDYLLTADVSLERRTVLMRETLEECRKTKRELEMAEAAHAEISDLFEAAWKMASFALFGALGRYEQEARNWQEQCMATKTLRGQYVSDADKVAGLQRQVTELEAQADLARSNADAGTIDLRNKEHALDLRSRLEGTRAEQASLRLASDVARTGMDADVLVEQEAITEQERALDEHTGLAEELGNTQKAYERLIRRVEEFKIARERLAEAQAVTLPYVLDRDNAVAIYREIDTGYAGKTREQTDAQALFDAADNQRLRFYSLLEQLCEIAKAQSDLPPAPRQAHAYAAALDIKLRDYALAAERIDSLESELVSARSLALQQQQYRQQAAGLGINSSATLIQAQGAVHQSVEEYEAARVRLAEETTVAQDMLLEAKGKLPALQEAARRYQLASSLRCELLTLSPAWAKLTAAEALKEVAMAGRAELAAVEERRRQIESDLRLTRERVRTLESSSGALDLRIGTVAEQVEGSLLSTRFDGLSPEEAAVTEARLGAWVNAIVVDVPEHAARLASELEDRPDTLLFVSGHTASLSRQAVSLDDSELVLEGKPSQLLARLTRRPARPVLGQRARQLEIERLTAEASEHESVLSLLRERARVLHQSVDLALNWLALGNAAWGPDPEPGLLGLQTEIRARELAIKALQSRASTLRESVAAVEERRRRLAELDSQRSLLDAPVFGDIAAELERERARALAARDWVAQHGITVRTILTSLPLLASVPDTRRHRQLERKIAQCKQARDIMSRQRDALSRLVAVIGHLDRVEDERQYHEQTSVIEALRAKLAPARALLDASRARLTMARNAASKSREHFLSLQAKLEQKITTCLALQSELAGTGAAGTSDEVMLSRRHLERAENAVQMLTRQHAVTNTDHIRAQAALETLNNSVQAQVLQATEQLAQLRFERRALRELRRVVKELDLQGRIDSETNHYKHLPSGSPINAFQASQEHRAVLLDRLRPYPEVLHALKEIEGFSEAAGERRAIQALHAWHRVRQHIEQRIPRTLASADDPQVALGQMTEKMGELRRTLEAQEQDMRNRSSGLADGISVRQRSARALVNRLNKELGCVSFGSIRGLSIKATAMDDMDKMLACLKRDKQLAMFDSGLPLEETLARLYQRETGGSIQGARLLDYRNYLRLHLEVQRLNGKWEATDNLSTGEAIGVGAAVLIMILRTWNEEANRISGSAGFAIQQILLDEANRLDQSALDTLTEFCQRMDVQALVAAPGLDKPRRTTVFQLQRGLRGKDEFVTIRGTRMTT